jgi:hypothetical protein
LNRGRGIAPRPPPSSARRRTLSTITLTPEQEAEAQRLAEVIGRKAHDEALRMARPLASKADAEIFGRTEYELRESAHRVAAHALEAALRGREKGGTTGRA